MNHRAPPRSLACAVLLCLAAAGHVPAENLTVDGYARRLESLASLLDEGDIEEARSAAGSLAGCGIEYDGGSIIPDLDLLDAVAEVRTEHEAKRLCVRLRALESVLSEAGSLDLTASAPDAALLEQLRRLEASPPVPEGGEVPLPGSDLEVPDSLASRLEAGWEALRDAILEFARWLRRLFASPGGPKSVEGGASMILIVAALIAGVMIVIVLTALRALRQGDGRAGSGAISSIAPSRSTNDEDPLSRDQAEWERYAARLGEEGRTREAVRAWYHAVLVALFSASLLHHRKGRTNWEYVATLPPHLPWRPVFAEITRRFEREWYGRESSAHHDLDACAGDARRILDAVGRSFGGGS